MLDSLYEYFRGATGFSLIVLGFGFFLTAGADRGLRAVGALYASVGLLFSMSSFQPYYVLPVDIVNILVVSVIFILSQSLFEIACFVFGGERREGTRRRAYAIGAAWSALIICLPLLDYAFRLGAVRVSVEDSRAMGPFHSLTAIALYAWPVAVSILSFRIGRWRVRDLPLRGGTGRGLLSALVIVALVMIEIIVAALESSVALYRLGHSLLEACMIAWYFYMIRHPEAMTTLRVEVEAEHERRVSLSAAESERIAKALEELVEDPRRIMDPKLRIGALADGIGVPAYRLSSYFNSCLGTSFPAWLNALRVECVCRIMLEEPGRTIIDIAEEVGYSSKAAFNSQFLKIKGMNPNEYRRSRSLEAKGGESFKKIV